MAKQENGRKQLINASAAERSEVFASYYNREGVEAQARVREMPSKRRQKHIALYKVAIGSGHRAILEMGCGRGDLTYALVDQTDKLVATDIAERSLKQARQRRNLWGITDEQAAKIEFRQMSAVKLSFGDGSFDWAVSTSMIEHLHPDDVAIHFREVHRILRPGGSYLIWCPNDLGHHEDREFHLSMFSYRQWMQKMTAAGFKTFRSSLTDRLPMVDARWKVFLESFFSKFKIKILWSHLGVRNVFLVATR